MTPLQRYRKQDSWLSPFFRDFWAPFYGEFDQKSLFSPQVDITETDEAYVLEADLPGMSEKDIKLELHDGILTLSGERKEEKDIKENGVHRRERFFGTFSRSFSVGDAVNAESIQANYSNGTLKVTLPKSAKKRPQNIQIKGK
jgi:HSP20 family protein